MRTAFAAGVLSLVVGCGADGRSGDPMDPVEPLARLDIRRAMKADDVQPIGMTIDANGTRFILDQNMGLYRVWDQALVQVVAMTDMPDPGPTAPIMPPFTDIVSLAPNVFAVTAIGDGYLLDIEAMTLTQHFCYLPDGGGGGVPTVITQRTDAMAYDPVYNKLWAQPITFDPAGTFIRAEIAKYDAATGADEDWLAMPDDTAATAMWVNGTNVLLGQGSKLMQRTLHVTPSHVVDDLERFGVKSIDGMVIDTASNRLIVVDSVADAMIDIDLDWVALE